MTMPKRRIRVVRLQSNDRAAHLGHPRDLTMRGSQTMFWCRCNVPLYLKPSIASLHKREFTTDASWDGSWFWAMTGWL